MNADAGPLRVAYAGHDFFSSCLQEIVENPSLEFVLCLTSGPGEPPAENVQTLARACNTSVYTGRFDGEMIAAVNEARVDLLVCAAYMHRIPIEKLSIGRAVNIHPTLLPYGRGPNPLPYLVGDHKQFSGISIHEMTPEFDKGPLLIREHVQVDEDDGLDELFLKLFAAAPRVLGRLIEDLDKYFERKVEQTAGSYWPEPSEQQRTLDLTTAHVAEISTLHSIFGMLGIILKLDDGTRLDVSRLAAARCEHSYRPGSIVAKLKYGWIVATVDGLVRLDAPRTLIE